MKNIISWKLFEKYGINDEALKNSEKIYNRIVGILNTLKFEMLSNDLYNKTFEVNGLTNNIKKVILAVKFNDIDRLNEYEVSGAFAKNFSYDKIISIGVDILKSFEEWSKSTELKNRILGEIKRTIYHECIHAMQDIKNDNDIRLPYADDIDDIVFKLTYIDISDDYPIDSFKFLLYFASYGERDAIINQSVLVKKNGYKNNSFSRKLF